MVVDCNMTFLCFYDRSVEFSKCLLSTYFIPGTVIVAGNSGPSLH